MSSTITLAPVSFAVDFEHASRIAVLATDLLGNTKGMWYSPLASEGCRYAQQVVQHVDTKVYLFNTDNDGEARAVPFALITKTEYIEHPSCDVDGHDNGTCAAVAAI